MKTKTVTLFLVLILVFTFQINIYAQEEVNEIEINEYGGEKLAEHLETNFLGKLPLITEVREAGDNGELVANSDMIGEEFENIADNVMDLIPEFDPSKEQMFLETE